MVNSQQVKYSERESIANQDRATQRTSLKDDWSFHQRNDKWEDVDFKLAARHDSLVMKERASNSRPKRDWWDADYDKGRQKKTKRNNKQHMRFQVLEAFLYPKKKLKTACDFENALKKYV